MKEREEYFDNIKIKFKQKKKVEKEDRKFKDVNFKKSLGQNFLSDKNLLNSIARIANVCKDDNVLEIGAGAGTLTEVLCANARAVLSYEIDRSLTERLNKIALQNSNLNIVYKDFMEEDLNNVFSSCKFKVVANIPYYITTPIIFKLVAEKERIDSMLFMVQKEVAERFSSKEGSKEYGIPSIILQSIADVKLEKVVPKECFTPMPNVDSALLKIEFKNKFAITDFEHFSNLVHAAFSMRRKTLVNNLIKNFNIKKEIILNNLKILNLNKNIRPEQISIENYINLSNNLKNNKNI